MIRIICHQNADAMVLVSVLMRSIHPHGQSAHFEYIQGMNAYHKHTD
jgi:hypothetical protein